MSAAGYDRVRLCREHYGVPARCGAQYGGNARDGTRAHDARRRRNLSAGRFLVSSYCGRFHLDGTMVSAMVRGHRQSACKISHLQGLESPSAGECPTMNLEIDRDRLSSEIEELATISDAEPPAVTRIVFTPTDLKARAWLRARCENAGLMVRQDAIGNTFARWAGSDPGAPVVGTGSPRDAIPNAGKYDVLR